MTNSQLVVPQRPRVLVEPADIASTAVGEDTVELAAHAGLVLDEWQSADLRLMMAERPDGTWAAKQFAEVVARQNGKGSILEARELGGLFLVRESLILHTAHLAVTSAAGFNRLLGLIENTPDLDRMIKRVSRSTQDMSIETKLGSKVVFRTRTKGGGRGLSAPCVILDEAMYLWWVQMSALMPTLASFPNWQIIYASSAGEAESEVLHGVRRSALRGDDPTLALCEYSAAPGDDPSAPETWAKANPSLCRRIGLEYVGKEHALMPAGEFARERLTIFDPDGSEAGSWSVVGSEAWAAAADEGSSIVSQVALAVEVDRDRSRAVVAAAGRNEAGLFHVELVECRDGVDWVVGRVAQIMAGHDDVAVVAVDPGGPAGFLIGPLTEAGVTVEPVSARGAAQACGLFAASAASGGIAHLDQPELSDAVRRATRRESGDVWYWKRTGDDESIQLIACTLALGQVPMLPDVAEPQPTYAY